MVRRLVRRFVPACRRRRGTCDCSRPAGTWWRDGPSAPRRVVVRDRAALPGCVQALGSASRPQRHHRLPPGRSDLRWPLAPRQMALGNVACLERCSVARQGGGVVAVFISRFIAVGSCSLRHPYRRVEGIELGVDRFAHRGGGLRRPPIVDGCPWLAIPAISPAVRARL